MRKVRWVMVLVGLTLCLGWSAPASAHVLVTDDSGQAGAILHIIPDDDPVAGQDAQLFFDIQAAATGTMSATLTITNTRTGDVATVPVRVEGTSVQATYTFPTQDVYRLVMQVSRGNQTYSFNSSQRVSRGVLAGPLAAPTYPWAELTLVGAISLTLVLLIIALNHRQRMKRYVAEHAK